MAENALFRILTAVKTCKNMCSQKSFDLEISANVKSASKSLNLKFQKNLKHVNMVKMVKNHEFSDVVA